MTSSPAQRSVDGLPSRVAAARLLAEGPNELPGRERRRFLGILLEVLREPMFLLLVGCGAVYFALGDPEEALTLLGLVFVVAGITLYQERRTEHALAALRDLSSPRALVIRDGRRVRIAGREVVREDVLVLCEGDRVAADAVLFDGANLGVDESLLTGESVPVRLRAGRRDAPLGSPRDEERGSVFAGTLVTKGSGLAEVRATGPRTELGRIGKALAGVTRERTRLQQETSRLVRVLAVIGAVLCVVVVVVFALTRADWLGGVLAGLTLAMAILPNEFPAVLTIFLAMGAWRISRSQVLTRRVPALESLGAATVLCTDKTGTLTLNRMSIVRLFAAGPGPEGRSFEVPAGPGTLPEESHEIVEYGILASQRDPFDPMEKAFHDLGARRLAGTEHLHPQWALVREYPLSDELLALSHVWRSPDRQSFVVAAKGAPEAIIDLCHLPEAEREAVRARVEALAEDGLRVLGVARARFEAPELPTQQHDFEFGFLGLVGLADPVRPGVPAAIAECAGAGIRVVMITGDHPRTAQAIAREVGLANPGDVMTGLELAEASDAELTRRLRTVNVFARVVPEQKLRLVRAFHAAGEVVAMTGDGVNDAPALKAADIGIAMGGRGTDVAREAAALVALDDDFTSIVRAIRLGRRIDDNLKSAMAYVLAIHVPIAGLTLVPVLFRLPLLLLPVQIAFLHLIIEPACSIVFEVEEDAAGVMTRPPRDPREPLFGRRLVGVSVLQGLSVLVVVLGVLAYALYRQLGELEMRGLTFTTLIVANLALIFSNRSWTRTIGQSLRTPNRALWWITGGAVVLLGLALYVRPLRALFRMSFLHGDDLLLCLAAAAASVAWFEGLKLLRQRGARARGG